jgi:hypothetical protein
MATSTGPHGQMVDEPERQPTAQRVSHLRSRGSTTGNGLDATPRAKATNAAVTLGNPSRIPNPYPAPNPAPHEPGRP